MKETWYCCGLASRFNSPGNHVRPALMMLLFGMLTFSMGCRQTPVAELATAKPPRPVSVMTLSRTKQIQRQLITGTIAPWQTEQIGFEVSGRVSFVIEQNEEVQPFLPSRLAAAPTPVAQVDRERLEIALATAEADKEVAARRLDANRVAIEQQLPALVESAESEKRFADAELLRITRLKKQNAISQSELDATENRMRTSEAALASAKAALARAEAEHAALESQVRRAGQSIEEARRNLRNTTLYSSFRGIVSEVHAVPGSFVNPGDPVATVQMMDPMLVQFEVSPKDSRTYAKGDILNVLVTDSTGKRQIANGMVYTVDAVSDPNSRTYTVTLHIRNPKESITQAAHQLPAENVARTRRVFALDIAPVITGGIQPLIERSCLHKIGDDTVIWKIVNRKANQASDPRDRVLMVEPVKVIAGTEEITLLGQWKFVPVEFVDPSVIDFKNDLVTGKLIYPAQTNADPELAASSEIETSRGLDPWAPRAVVLEQPSWQLRAGDVVQVVKSGGSLQQGFFVPMKAIVNDNGETFVHTVEEDEQGKTIAKRVAVDIQKESSLADDAIFVQVRSKVAGELADGTRLVVRGSHYLSDKARVKVVDGAER